VRGSSASGGARGDTAAGAMTEPAVARAADLLPTLRA
jgi:hypothetical protein